MKKPPALGAGGLVNHGKEQTFRSRYTYCRQIRKPLTLSSMTTFISTLMRSRRKTSLISRFARGGSRHGMKIDVPRLKAFQFIS